MSSYSIETPYADKEICRSSAADVALTVTLLLLPVALWILTHRYRGLVGDGELYAVQALARNKPTLANDLFLQNASQDTYTVFSPLYASLIGLLGLRNAGIALFVLLKIWFFGASWITVRKLSNGYAAIAAVALLILLSGDYGAFHVFHFSEDMLTARSLAEALTVSSMAFYVHGYRTAAFAIATCNLFVHALLALPAILLLICLSLPFSFCVLGAAVGIFLALAVAAGAHFSNLIAQLFPIMDSDWLEVVRERSQFLFLQLWTTTDWKSNALPFESLAISALVISDTRIRKVSVAAILVGATGLAIALISSLIGPVAILLQGQAWRWVWITALMSVLLLAPSIQLVWRDQRCGPLCTVLMLASWTFSAIDGASYMAIALVLWTVRRSIPLRLAPYARFAAGVIGLVLAAWIIMNAWTIVSSPPPETGREPLALQITRNVLGLDGLSLILAGLLVLWIRSTRSVAALSAASLGLCAASALALPGAFRSPGVEGVFIEAPAFSDWRKAIPPDNNVLVIPAHNSAAFAWFTLQRPSYLSVDQSSGVIFSRSTALEIRRRSEMLLPLMDPDWRLLSRMRESKTGTGRRDLPARRLTRGILVTICSDPKLNFVIATENVGIGSVAEIHTGIWKNWSLYDCGRVNSTGVLSQ